MVKMLRALTLRQAFLTRHLFLYLFCLIFLGFFFYDLLLSVR